jgi:ABC-type lipoprotein export system ATPase subunit
MSLSSLPSVEAVELGHRFPGTAMLFEHLSFTLAPGELTGLCGPSGCGKSTLLSLLAGWEKPTSGQITRNNIHKTGWVFQNPHGVAARSALDHVAFPLLCRGMPRRQAEPLARQTLSRFHLDNVARQPFSSLSGGEAQRLMLARAVCVEPDLLLVDEPTAQLDTKTAHSVNDTLGNIAIAGTIVVIATHDPHTRAVCQHVIDLDPPSTPIAAIDESMAS